MVSEDSGTHPSAGCRPQFYTGNKNSPRKRAIFVTNELGLPPRQDIASVIILVHTKEKSKSI
jgi:hypothetical protein